MKYWIMGSEPVDFKWTIYWQGEREPNAYHMLSRLALENEKVLYLFKLDSSPKDGNPCVDLVAICSRDGLTTHIVGEGGR